MRFSVVIATYNRAASLRQTLLALRHQVYPDFEVIVVTCPSTDGTEEVLAEFAGRVRVYRCPVVSSTVSRNIGVAESAGDVVAFIDDDALPTPYWLEELAVAYREPGVGAAGGRVYDNTGVALQYRFAVCRRDGEPIFHVDPPFNRYLRPHADPVAYLQGTNMSCARKVLQEVGGFDENIAHYHDDVELSARVIDRGYKLKVLDGAAVHHKFLASYARNHDRVLLDPFSVLTGRFYFALMYGRSTRSTQTLVDGIVALAAAHKAQADVQVGRGEMTPAQRDFHNCRVDEAIAEGLAKGLAGRRAGRELPDPRPDAFVRFPTIAPAGPRMKLCFVSREYPPGDFGGPGRYTQELAAGFAAAGHEAHVVTRSPDVHRIDFEDGVWVHRVPEADRLVPELDGVACRSHLYHMAAVYHEVGRIHADRPVDLVSAPMWLCEALVCGADDRFPTVTTLITGMKALAAVAAWAREAPECRQLAALEEDLVARSPYLHAVSASILDKAIADYGADPARAFVANLGVRDRADRDRRRAEDGRVRVLYVGRVETRKGVDLFLEAAARLCREFPHAEFVLAGKEIPIDQGDTHRQRFEAEFAADAAVRSRVTFTGMVSEDELDRQYAESDVVCLPSRFESFGLTLVEAMVFGKPVVGARAGGMAEVVAHGEQGYLFPPGDADALTDCLRALIADGDLRARFGRRSRELYEQRFSIPVTVARCEQRFRRVAAEFRSRPGCDPAGPAPVGRVGRAFADTLTRALGVPADQARAAAARLLDPQYHPTDYPRHFQKCWHTPAPDFVREAVRALLGRPPRHDEVEWWTTATAQAGLTRIGLLRMIASTPEARARGLADGWLQLLEAACGPGSFPVPATPDRPGWRQRVRQRLGRTRHLGRALRYVRRAVLLPWTFHKFCQDFWATERHVRELAAAQDRLLRLVQGLESVVVAGQDETRAMIDQRLAQVTDAPGAIAGGGGTTGGPPAFTSTPHDGWRRTA
jgi:glycosyltransferase involved in cell wall biosynthesis/GT2 family glycosyltransferase